jgi:hypothetical protein
LFVAVTVLVALPANAQLVATQDVVTTNHSIQLDERETVATDLARFTGFPIEQIDRDSLVVSLKDFSERLLGAEGRVLGRYDARLSRPRRESEEMFDPVIDASLAPLEGKISGNAPVMIRYLRNVLWRHPLPCVRTGNHYL